MTLVILASGIVPATLPLAPLGTLALPALLVTVLPTMAGASALAFAVHRLLGALGSRYPGRCAVLCLALPGIVTGARLPGQYELWSMAASVMAVTVVVERRHAATLGWFGLAVAVQPQAAVLAPFVLAILLQRRIPWRTWLILLPMVTLAILLSATGWPAVVKAASYHGQTDAWLFLDEPGWSSVLRRLPGLMLLPPLGGLVLGAAAGASAAYVACFAIRRLDGHAVVAAALLAVLLTTFLLPGGTGHPLLLADILALVLPLGSRLRVHWPIAMLVLTASLLGAAASLTRMELLAPAGALMTIGAAIHLARTLVHRAANDNPVFPPRRAAQSACDSGRRLCSNSRRHAFSADRRSFATVSARGACPCQSIGLGAGAL